MRWLSLLRVWCQIVMLERPRMPRMGYPIFPVVEMEIPLANLVMALAIEDAKFKLISRLRY
jgi:hypothetical protein